MLEWKGIVKNWQEEIDEYYSISLVFEEVSYLWTTPRDPAYPFTEDTCLDMCGYLDPNNIDTMDSCIIMENTPDDYHMIFIFHSEMAIRVYAKKATALATKYIV